MSLFFHIVSLLAGSKFSIKDKKAPSSKDQKRIIELEARNKKLKRKNSILRGAAKNIVVIKALLNTPMTQNAYNESEVDDQEIKNQSQRFSLEQAKMLEEMANRSETTTVESVTTCSLTESSSSENEVNTEEYKTKKENDEKVEKDKKKKEWSFKSRDIRTFRD